MWTSVSPWREEALPGGIIGPAKNKPLILPEDQSIICPSDARSFGAAASWVDMTPDFGRHWSRHGPIIAEEGGALGGRGLHSSTYDKVRQTTYTLSNK
jgi:hypothetical protein